MLNEQWLLEETSLERGLLQVVLNALRPTVPKAATLKGAYLTIHDGRPGFPDVIPVGGPPQLLMELPRFDFGLDSSGAVAEALYPYIFLAIYRNIDKTVEAILKSYSTTRDPSWQYQKKIEEYAQLRSQFQLPAFLLTHPTIETAIHNLYRKITRLRHCAIHASWRSNDRKTSLSDRSIDFVDNGRSVQKLTGKQLDLLIVVSLLLPNALVANQDPLEAAKTLHTLAAALHELQALHNTVIAAPDEEWWYDVHYYISAESTSSYIDIDSVMKLFAERGASHPVSARVRYNFLINHRSQDRPIRMSEAVIRAGGLVSIEPKTKA